MSAREAQGSGTRVIMFMGKGGVGKTTVAAASAILAAESGQRVVVTSTDPAHSLGDVLGRRIGSVPVQVTPGCHAQQLNGRDRLEESWAEVGGWVRRAFGWAGLDDLEAQELMLLPGLEELFALAEVTSLVDSGRFDTVIVDCAPTAETLRLLTLPEVLGFYLDRFEQQRPLRRAVSETVRRLGDLPIADAQIAGATHRLADELSGVRRLLSADTTSVRLVMTPERVVIAETRRTHTALGLHGYATDAVVVNRLLPEHVSDDFTARWRSAQLERLDEVREGFGGVDTLIAEMSPIEPIGAGTLAEMARVLYDGREPTAVLGTSQPMSVVTGADGPELHLPLPNADRGEVDVWAGDGEIHLTVGAHRRNLLLPDALHGRSVVGASLSDGTLVIRFDADVDAERDDGDA